VGIPLVAFVTIFGYTRFAALNVAIGVLGYFSVFVAGLNLLPIRPLDGAKAWYVLSRIFKPPALKRQKHESVWRSYR